MEKIVTVNGIGHFTYSREQNSYIHNEGLVHWALKLEDESTDVDVLVNKAKLLVSEFERFEQLAKIEIAEELLEYKNDFWPAYDENDVQLDWDAVDAGEYDVTIEQFVELISLLFIEIRSSEIYCEYLDGDLFGGHRIHAYFNDDYKLIKAEI
ncbi:DUF2262 domain-containing protein [Paenibacillus sp. SN-8-1]|uniref:DUF2262 domain-containing protein n=1 Tax=Paenibacillus sp. SN-8-1 TaxID=3435409 RepID=UPI003D9A97EA